MNFKKILMEIKETYLVLRLKEIKHRLTYERNNNRMAQAMERFKKCDNKKPESQLKKEMNLCKQYWRCYPLHYYRYDLYKKNKELSERELLNYIPEFFFYGLFLPFYDSREYAVLLENKIITEQIFRSVGIPQTHTICKLINNHVYNNELGEKRISALEQELAEKKYQKIFVKPVDGEGGYGIHIFKRNDRGQYVTENNDVFNEGFLYKIGARNDYIIQSGIEQAPEISKIYPYSVNTVRIATENKNGNIRILCATLRMGRNGNEVDNGSQGGLFIKIDVKTGEMGHHATSHQLEYCEKHPDTVFTFRGHKILSWKKIKEITVESAKKLPQFTYLGWDIAIAKNGPLVIETNLNFGLDHYQFALGGLREVFQISNPQFYWKNKGKRT